MRPDGAISAMRPVRSKAAMFGLAAGINLGLGEAICHRERGPRRRRSACDHSLRQEDQPGATIFNVVATTFDKVHERLTAIEFEADIDAAPPIAIAGVVDTAWDDPQHPSPATSTAPASRCRAV